MSLAAIASGAPDAHINYWKCSQTAKIIVDNILGTQDRIIDIVIEQLKKVPGMTITLIEATESAKTKDYTIDNGWHNYLGEFDKLIESFQFSDRSGKLNMRDNIAQIPHIYLYNNNGNCQLSGYVGLLHANGLRQEVEAIKRKYRLKVS